MHLAISLTVSFWSPLNRQLLSHLLPDSSTSHEVYTESRISTWCHHLFTHSKSQVFPPGSCLPC